MTRERHDLRARFENLAAIEQEARLYELREIIALMARRSQFQVEPGLRNRRREHVDLVAALGDDAFLFHITALDRAVAVEDVHTFWKDLGDESSDVVGVLVSPNGFADDVAAQIVQSPSPPVVLLGAKELDYLLDWPGELRQLLRLKVDRLRRHRQVAGAEILEGLDWMPEALDADEVWLVDEEGQRLDWVMSGGEFGRFTFAGANNMVDERGSSDLQRLELRVAASTQTEILALFEELEDLGWVTPNGRWSIQQSGVNWHGVSAQDLRTALVDWERRYAQAGETKLHVGEDVVYSDANVFGAYTLSFNADAHEDRRVWHAHLALQLAGVPMDPLPYQELARTVGDNSVVFLRGGLYGAQRSWWPPTDVELDGLKPIARVVGKSRIEDDDTDYLCGVVVRNPFLAEAVAATLNKECPDALLESDLLVCTVGHWHPLRWRANTYHIINVNWAQTGEGTVVQVRAGWNRLA